jgi:cytoskeletal protein CcmA (bactofilin family)
MNNIETIVNSEKHPGLYIPDNSNNGTDSLNSGKGDLSFKGDLIISGIFSGKLNVSGSLTLGINARVSGEIEVNDLFVFGHLCGCVRAINLAVFHSDSSFSGILTAREAEFRTGSLISGKRNVGRITEKETITTHKNSIFNLEDPASIPDEMTHFMFRP